MFVPEEVTVDLSEPDRVSYSTCTYEPIKNSIEVFPCPDNEKWRQPPRLSIHSIGLPSDD